jgi:hypothetical protein
VVLKHVELDPEYELLLDECLDEVAQFSESLEPGMRKREGFVFISSPRSVTPYHLDPEYNFLLQVSGMKRVRVWDPGDRLVLSEQELEDFFTSEEQRGLTYKIGSEEQATLLELNPGSGLHVPVTAPHWVENGETVSVSFSITFQTPANERRAAVYRVNAGLRRLGFNPTPFGGSGAADFLKYNGWRAVGRLRRSINPGSSER